MTQTESAVAVDIKPTEKAEVDPEVSESLVSEKLLKQVEYYFGDNNLPRDRFIKEACSKNEGWMPIESLLNFNRVKAIVIDVAEDARVAKIAEILKASELVDVDEAGTKIRRNPNVPISDINTETRTVYLKGFHRSETVLDQLLEFFGKYEGMEAVIMRYYKEKTIETEVKSQDGETTDAKKEKVEPKIVWERKFKGSIFVVFKTPEQAKKLLEEEDLVVRGTTITIKLLHSDYRKQKLDEYKERIANRTKKDGVKSGEGGADETGKGDKDKPLEIPDDIIIKGALLKVSNIPDQISREDFKLKWYEATNEEEFKIVFVDFNKGDKEGVLRLEKEGSAVEALKLLPEGKLKMDEDKFIDLAQCNEAEETEYLQKISKKRQERKRTGNFGGRGRGGRGGRGFKRRRY